MSAAKVVRQAFTPDHRTYRRRILWWFRRRGPEYDSCRRVAEEWNTWSEGRMHFTPGQIWTLRRAKEAGRG